MDRKGLTKTNCHDCNSLTKSSFCHATEASRVIIDNAKTCHKYTRAERLFSQGEPVSGVYCLKSGKVKVSVTDTLGNESIIRVLGPGSLIGHRSIMCGEKDHQASVYFLEESEVCFVEQHVFQQLIKSDPELVLTLSQQFASDVADANATRVAMVHHSVKERVCTLLLSLANAYGRQAEDGIHIELKLTREEMASMIGTTPETMIRTISALKEEKLISQNGKNIIILDKSALADQAGFI